jgi:hypothetical protein
MGAGSGTRVAVAALLFMGGAVAGCSSGSGGTPLVTHSIARDPFQPSTSTGRLTLDPGHDYGDKYSNGLLPVGDGRYRTSGARKGYVYVCSQYAQALAQGGGGASTRGPWFTDNNQKYDVKQKAHVRGSVSWHSVHSFEASGSKRLVRTNDLPSHTTGTYPIQSSDPAYRYDHNPNSISAQSISLSLTLHPRYGAPQCVGGEVGVMTTGVMLFNAFDAGGRDAGAWEVQDHCDGHPEMDGVYHYHTLSSCITNLSVHHVIGWAFDGFPITGPYVNGAKDQLTTSDLDACHGITSTVRIDGKSVTTYHYVMTADFPYSVSCFRATPVTTGPVPAPAGMSGM